MSEDTQLQNDAAEAEVNLNQAEIAEPEKGTGLAPEKSEAEHKEKPQVDDAEAEAAAQKAKAQEGIQKAINKSHREAREAERKTAELQTKLDEIETEKQEKLAASVANIPDLPVYPSEPFDANYAEQVANYNQAIIDRDAKIQAKATFDANQNILTQQTQYQQQQQAQVKANEMAELSNSFFGNARDTGATDTEINSVINLLNNAGMTGDLGAAIMTDKTDGYFIAKHLAENLVEVHELMAINPIMAGAKLAEIKAKASALKPNTTQTPKPTQDIKGAGAKTDLNKYPNSDGAKFT
jgi:hypothetical protein